jgi:hypothetical protein
MPDDDELPEEWQLANRLLDVHGPTRLGEMFVPNHSLANGI